MSGLDLSIVRMRPPDIDEIYQLGLFQDEFSSSSSSFWTKEQLLAWCQSRNDLLLVAKNNNKIIGFSFYAVHFPTKKVTWENLYVVPEARGSGVAKRLTAEGLKQLKQMGYVYLMLCVNAKNQESFIRFLENYGFKRGNKVWWVDLSL